MTDAPGVPVHDADEQWMRHALALAERAQREFDEIPVGAVLVGADGQLLGEGWNLNIASHDPSAHAEIVAMRAGGKALANHRLLGSTLYVTLEPCAMCAAAISFARIRRLYFGASDPKGGGVEHGGRFYAQPTCHHAPDVYGGIAETQSAHILTEFFRLRREPSQD